MDKTLIERKIEFVPNIDVLKNTCGAWNRTTTFEEDMARSRSEFNKSMKRHHINKNHCNK